MSLMPDVEPVLFDFSRSDAIERWSTVNDGVMGGVSSSRITWTDDGTMRFSGTVSLENNGGFASIRSGPALADLSPYAGLVLRARGDGRRYSLNVYMTEAPRISYRAAFETVPERWYTYRIRFADLTPTFRGRRVDDAPPFDPTCVQAFGILIADQQAGPFRLELCWLKAASNS